MQTRGTYMLDTCICIGLIKKMPSVVDHIRQVGADECKISEITLAEMYFERIPGLRIENWME